MTIHLAHANCLCAYRGNVRKMLTCCDNRAKTRTICGQSHFPEQRSPPQGPVFCYDGIDLGAVRVQRYFLWIY